MTPIYFFKSCIKILEIRFSDQIYPVHGHVMRTVRSDSSLISCKGLCCSLLAHYTTTAIIDILTNMTHVDYEWHWYQNVCTLIHSGLTYIDKCVKMQANITKRLVLQVSWLGLQCTKSVPERSVALTIVLDDAFEVVSHKVAESTLVGQPKTVGENHSRVHNHTVQQLREYRTGLEFTEQNKTQKTQKLCVHESYLKC